jgi:hypothetical protein
MKKLDLKKTENALNSVMMRLLIMLAILTGLTNCGGNAETVTIKTDENVATFLNRSLPTNYSFYAFKNTYSKTTDDLRENGIMICSRIPNGLLPENVINGVYGGAFLSGTVLSLVSTTDGVEKFGDIRLSVAIRISPDGCKNAVEKGGGKAIMLFSDDDVKRLKMDGLVKVTFK